MSIVTTIATACASLWPRSGEAVSNIRHVWDEVAISIAEKERMLLASVRVFLIAHDMGHLPCHCRPGQLVVKIADHLLLTEKEFYYHVEHSPEYILSQLPRGRENVREQESQSNHP